MLVTAIVPTKLTVVAKAFTVIECDTPPLAHPSYSHLCLFLQPTGHFCAPHRDGVGDMAMALSTYLTQVPYWSLAEQMTQANSGMFGGQQTLEVRAAHRTVTAAAAVAFAVGVTIFV